MAEADLTAYVPRLLLEWEAEQPHVRHRGIEGTLVFADVSGFTRLSERLARAGGKIGAEQMTDVINALFGDLLLVAAARGGEMLKYGGDAILVFFTGDAHAPRATAACWEMQKKLAEIGRVDTGAGVVRLRMSVGVHSGTFDFFKVGGSHEELVVAGPATTETVAMEAAAEATEVLLSPATAACLPPSCVGAEKAGGRLLRRVPKAPLVEFHPLRTAVDAGKFLSVALRDYLAGGLVDPDHRLASVAFMHVMGLDARLAAEDPDVVAGELADTMERIQESCARLGVSFLATDLAGDGTKVMLAAGAPFAEEDDAGRMLRVCAEACSPDAGLAVRAGINRGHVFAGDVGPPFRRTFTTIGDVTNTAARVMGRAGAREVLALESVLEAARGAWRATPLEPFTAKGKREPLLPYRVEGEAEAGFSGGTELVGREAELEKAVSLLPSDGDASRLLQVVGETGLGKSRLLAEIERVATERGVVCHRAVSTEYDASSPYALARRLLRSMLGTTSPDEVSARLDRAPALRPWLPLLGLVLGVPFPATPEVERLDPAAVPDRIAWLLGEVAAALTSGPALVILEDAHWADASSIPLLNTMRRRLVDEPVLFVSSRRPSGGGWEPPAADRIELAPLDEDAAHRLVEIAVGRPLLPQEARAVAERSGGNPLFLEQLAHSRIELDELPNRVEEVVASRIDALPPADRLLLRQAAVLGPRFPLALLRSIDPDALSRLSDFLEEDGGDRVHFRHVLLQQVAYEGLPYRRRRDLHLVAAEAIEGSTEPGEEAAAALSRHFHFAGAWAKSWHYSRLAAEEAERRYVFTAAALHWNRAADAGRRLGVAPTELAATHRAAGEARRRAAELQLAKTSFRLARRASAAPADRAPLALAMARVLYAEGRADRASAWTRRGMAEATGAGPDVVHEVTREGTSLVVDIAFDRGRYSKALALAKAQADAAARAGDTLTRAKAQSIVHVAAQRLRLPETTAEGELAARLAEAAANRRLQSNVLNNLGVSAHRAGRWDEALDLYRRAMAAADESGFVLAAAAQANNIAEILVDQGHLEEGRRLLERARATALAAGHWHAAYHLANLGRVAARAGEHEAAEQFLDRAQADLERLGLRAVLPEVDLRRAELAVMRGAPSARERIDELLGGPGADDITLLVWRSHANRQRGEVDAAAFDALAASAAARTADQPFVLLCALEAHLRLGEAPVDEGEIMDLRQRLGVVSRPTIP